MLVSILICTFNGEKFLEKTILSAINQTYKNIEIIIVDDGSIDNSKNIILDYSKLHKNIRFFFQKNTGLAGARNKAIKESLGKWIAFLDQDDLFNIYKIEKLIKLSITNYKINFFFHDTHYINENDIIIDSHMGKYKLPFPLIKKYISTNLLIKYGSYIDSESVFFKKSIIDVVGFLKDTSTHLLCEESINYLMQKKFLSNDGESLIEFADKKSLIEYLGSLSTKKQTQRALIANKPAPAALSIPDDACHYHPSLQRTLTVREMARFQSFPDKFEFRSKVTTGGKMRRFEVPQYTQVGNAVPPLLGRALGSVVKNILKYQI